MEVGIFAVHLKKHCDQAVFLGHKTKHTLLGRNLMQAYAALSLIRARTAPCLRRSPLATTMIMNLSPHSTPLMAQTRTSTMHTWHSAWTVKKGRFSYNNERRGLATNERLLMLPELANEDITKFDSWYSVSECTQKIAK